MKGNDAAALSCAGGALGALAVGAGKVKNEMQWAKNMIKDHAFLCPDGIKRVKVDPKFCPSVDEFISLAKKSSLKKAKGFVAGILGASVIIATLAKIILDKKEQSKGE